MKGFREHIEEATMSADVPQAAGQLTPSDKPTDKNTKELAATTKRAATPHGEFCGGPFFEVDFDTFTNCRNGKPPRKWWDTSTKTSGMRQFIQENPKQSPVWLKHKNYYSRLR